MNKADLAKRVSDCVGITPVDSKKAVDVMLGEIVATVRRSEKVELHGFGTFKAHTRPAGKSRNPRTGEAVDVPARTKLAFRPVPSLSVAG